eukprot:2875080-Pleurochrysis_carterae.AAC.1
MRYESTQQHHEGNAQRHINVNAKTCKCECMTNIQSRNLKAKTDPLDRGSLASIALPRKLAFA